jgi:hypothetical protein
MEECWSSCWHSRNNTLAFSLFAHYESQISIKSQDQPESTPNACDEIPTVQVVDFPKDHPYGYPLQG